MKVAPSEPPIIKTLGQSSIVPERFGADILWVARGALAGVQRKELRDLLASIQDGRLNRELAQMARLGFAGLVVEGEPRWTVDGVLVHDNGHGWSWTRTQHRNLLVSVQTRGVVVVHTDNAADTVLAVRDLASWTRKASHTSLLHRPKPQGSWGKAGSREYALHLLQSFDGVGPKQAEAILNHFNGVPLAWLCTEKQLREVPGIGPVRAQRMIGALDVAEAPAPERQTVAR